MTPKPASEVLRIKCLSETDWARECADMLVSAVAECIRTNGHCSVMLTGGRSAETLYKVWGKHAGFWSARSVSYYFGDERCVSPEDANSNFGMVMRTLFMEGIPEGCVLHRMEGEHANTTEAADRYAACLPPQIDILLLSVGEDGHVASIFPHSSVLNERQKKIVSTVGPKPPYARLSITPLVIQNAKKIFVLSFGPAKRQILNRLTDAPNDYVTIPARLAMSGEWFIEGIYDQGTI